MARKTLRSKFPKGFPMNGNGSTKATKARRKLDARIRDYEKTIGKSATSAYTCPGSMKK